MVKFPFTNSMPTEKHFSTK